MDLKIDSTCIECHACKDICPEGAIVSDGKLYAIDSWLCTHCHLCTMVCPSSSIKKATNNE